MLPEIDLPQSSTLKGDHTMTVHDLNREQLTEIKERYYIDHHPDGVSYGELADIDELVSDDEVFTEYEEIEFVPDDFWH
jgi:hypothetical protein